MLASDARVTESRPGAIAARLHTPDGLDAGFVVAFALAGTTAWLGLTLAEVGLLHRSIAIAGLVGLALPISYLAARSIRGARPPRMATAILLSGILAAHAVAVLPGADPRIDGADESVYLNVAARIARTGGLVTPDPLLAAIPAREWPRLFSRDRFWPQRLNRFPGGVQIAESAPVLQPNFFHLLPAWLALTQVLVGTSTFVPPLCSVLSIAALFLVTRRLVSEPAALAAAALLAINGGQIWGGRLPLSELPTQLFVLCTLFFAVWMLQTDARMPSVAAGAALGLAACSRIDVWLLVLPIVAGVLALDALRRGWRPSHRAYSLAAIPLLLQAGAHALTVSQPYTLRIFGHASRDAALPSLLAAGICALLAATILLWPAARRHLARSLTGWSHGAGLLAIVGGVLWLAVRAGSGPLNGPLATLMSPPGVLLALGGLLLFVRDQSTAGLLVVALTMVSAAAYLDRARDIPVMPGVFRRVLPVLLPFTILAVTRLLLPLHAGRWPRLAGAVTLAALVVASAPRGLASAMTPVPRHLGAAIRGVVQDVPPEALVLVDAGLPSHLALALEHTVGYPTLALDHALATHADLRDVVQRAQDRRQPLVVLVDREGGASSLVASMLAGFPVRALGDREVHYDTGRRSTSRWPEGSMAVTHRVSRFLIESGAAPRRPPIRLNVGAADLGVVIRGVGASERMLDADGRWTTADARFALPKVSCDGQVPLQLSIRLATLRPDGLLQPQVSLWLDQQPLTTFRPQDSGFHVYAVRLSPADGPCGRFSSVMVRSDVFNPRRDAGIPDSRTLGVAVDWLEVTSIQDR